MTHAAAKIIIVGLGPGNPTLRTIGTQRALDEADAVVLRTRIHPGLNDLIDDPRVSDCDDLYERADGFETLYAAISERVVGRATAGGTVIYAVPGHPRFAERSVTLVENRAMELNIPVDVLDAVSFVDTTISAIRRDPVANGLQIVDAEHLAEVITREPFAAGSLAIDPTRPLLIAQLYNHDLAVATKLALGRVYPDDHVISLLRGSGVPEDMAACEVPLFALDRQEPDHLTSLWVPALEPLDAVRSADSVARIVARLRAPGGCPWDREQTHASLRNAVLAEAYEVVDAIDAGDQAALVEELGDLLLLVMMHAQLAEEAGDFGIEDVYEEISRKLIRRHPHVFGSVQADTPDAVVSTWEGVKAAERAAKGEGAQKGDRLSRLPRSMPATRKAIEVLAPRTELTAPVNDHAGDHLLAAITTLLEQRIDPELALEAALRQRAIPRTDDESQMAEATAVTNALNVKG
jgi:tetrapyrrole methylase family protein / MazG family protein